MAFDANDLSPHEHFVLERTRLGEFADFSALGGADGSKPGVRAGFLRKLLLGLEADWRVPASGVRIKGARIDGALDLTDCSGQAPPSLHLANCTADIIDISRARLMRLALTQCVLRRLIAIGAHIEGDLDLADAAPLGPPGKETLSIDARGARIAGAAILSGAKLARRENGDALALDRAAIAGALMLDQGFEAFGRVSLVSARIGGGLLAAGAALLNRAEDASGVAIAAAGAHFGADVALNQRCKAEGALDFTGAAIDGNVDIDSASLRNDGGAALLLSGARVRGGVSGAAKLAGQARFDAATIGGALNLRGAEIAHPLSPRGEAFGVAIDAAGACIAGDARLEGANIKGETRLSRAQIGGALLLGGGRFLNSGARALDAGGARIGGAVCLAISADGYAPHGQKTVVEGGASFQAAHIQGDVTWRGLELRGPSASGDRGGALSFADARIAGATRALALTTHQGARIDMAGAACALLADDAKSGWGGDSVTLVLDAFAYERLDESDRWQARLSWLKRARPSLGAYAQAARAYARAGQANPARRVLLAGRDAVTARASAGPFSWLLSSLFGAWAGYGLAPVRMLRTLALFFAIGVIGVLAMNAQGGLVNAQGRACNGAVEPALYAADVALPLIDLGQETRCAPGRTARADLPAGIAIGEDDWRLFEGVALWRWAWALYAAFGAIFSVLAVITFSGMMRPRAR